MFSSHPALLRGRRRLAGLALKGCALKKRNTGEYDGEDHSTSQKCAPGREIAHEHGGPAANRAEEIERENRATMAEPQIGETVRRMVLPWRSERKQAAARTGDRHQRGIENGHAQDENRGEPRRKMIGLLHADVE